MGRGLRVSSGPKNLAKGKPSVGCTALLILSLVETQPWVYLLDARLLLEKLDKDTVLANTKLHAFEPNSVDLIKGGVWFILFFFFFPLWSIDVIHSDAFEMKYVVFPGRGHRDG